MILLPEHVRSARGLLKITQAQLAEMAGVNLTTVHLFEKGERTPSEDTLLRIETALKQQGIVFFNGGNPGVRLMRNPLPET